MLTLCIHVPNFLLLITLLVIFQVERIASMCEYSANNTWLYVVIALEFTMQNCTVMPQTVYFSFDQNNDHGVASTLHSFKPLAPRLQCPTCRLKICYKHRLNGNHVQLLKPLNNAQYCTKSTRLRGHFHPS